MVLAEAESKQAWGVVVVNHRITSFNFYNIKLNYIFYKFTNLKLYFL